MKVSFELDPKGVPAAALCGVVGLVALHAAFPGLYDYWPKNSSDLAAWFQAFGAAIAIVVAIVVPARQRAQERVDHKMEVRARAIISANSVLLKVIQARACADTYSRKFSRASLGTDYVEPSAALAGLNAVVRPTADELTRIGEHDPALGATTATACALFEQAIQALGALQNLRPAEIARGQEKVRFLTPLLHRCSRLMEKAEGQLTKLAYELDDA